MHKDFKKQTCRQQSNHFIYSTPALSVLFFLYNCMKCIDGSSILLQVNDAKTPAFLAFVCYRKNPFSSPEPTILLACGRNRELWEQPFRACAIDQDCVKPDGQNSVISMVFFFLTKIFFIFIYMDYFTKRY